MGVQASSPSSRVVLPNTVDYLSEAHTLLPSTSNLDLCVDSTACVKWWPSFLLEMDLSQNQSKDLLVATPPGADSGASSNSQVSTVTGAEENSSWHVN